MAYTNAWTDSVPLGSEAAGNIDDFMRRARLDIHERMNDVVVDWTADPVVPKAPGGIASDLIRIIPYSSWLNDYHGVAGVGVFKGYSVGASGEGPYVATLNGIIPRNATITKIEHRINAVDGLITWTLAVTEVDFPAPFPLVSTDLFTISTSVNGVQTLDSGAISITLDSDNKQYSLTFVDTAGAAGHLCGLFGTRITYTLP